MDGSLMGMGRGPSTQSESALEDRSARAVAVVGDEEGLASTGLLSFYDRLRLRTTRFAARRSGRLGSSAVEALLLAPDLFVLLARLSLDSRVAASKRRLLIGAVAYFLTPIDLMPEGVIGPLGYLEDVILASAVLRMTLNSQIEPLAESYWSGSQRLRVVLGDLADAAYGLLGSKLYSRLQRLLSRRGLDL